MHEIRFSWDERKNRSNQQKHGVSFEEAQTAFHDENAKVYFDPDHSSDEDRFILLGISSRPRVLIVCHCYRENDSIIPGHLGSQGGQAGGEGLLGMRSHYDFSKMKGRKNPYAKRLKRPVTIRLDQDTVAYFKAMAVKTGLPYQNLINLYLRDCAVHGRELSLKWVS